MKAVLLALALLAAPAAAQDEAPAVDHSQDIAWHNAQQAYIAALKQADG